MISFVEKRELVISADIIQRRSDSSMAGLSLYMQYFFKHPRVPKSRDNFARVFSPCVWAPHLKGAEVERANGQRHASSDLITS